MDMTVGLGLLAGGLTTASFVPQVAKIWKTKSAEDVSLTMFVAFCLGVALWLAYGVIKKDWAILVTNGVTLLLGLAILVMKIKYR
ncbi:MAG TPA: SemiSWEET transporter [Pyrinomonadaceae bacterium]|jgi:MtN3 and saliva related transmembrane protein